MMAWAFTACGKPKTVAKKARDAAATKVLSDPEESVRKLAMEFIAQSVDNVAGKVVRVRASGNMAGVDGAVQSNTISVQIEPVIDWIE